MHAPSSEARYVSLVASPKRAAVVREALQARGVAPDGLARLKAPAGLDLGAVTPEEIAVSILAEIVQSRRSAKPDAERPAPRAATEARDPICGMLVEIATAVHRSEVGGRDRLLLLPPLQGDLRPQYRDAPAPAASPRLALTFPGPRSRPV